LNKVAVFVDVQNIYYTVKQGHKSHFNYSQFWKMLESRGEIVKAIAYAIEPQDTKQRNFQNLLSGIGFEVKVKPYIQRSDGSAKGDWDVGITIDVLDIAPTVETVILASGDGDFDLLLQSIKNKYSVSTEVFGVKALTADSLIRSASRYTPIEKELLIPING
jgi:uncharacterized LabA/DUF88 family protein